MPSLEVWNCGVLVEAGIFAGFMREEAGCGGETSEGRGPVVGPRCLRMSRSSKSSSRSSMSPSDGSLAGSLSLTSSIRACDIVCFSRELWSAEGGVGGVEVEFRSGISWCT